MFPARALIMGMEELQQLLVGLWTMMTGGAAESRLQAPPPAGSKVRAGAQTRSKMISGLIPLGPRTEY